MAAIYQWFVTDLVYYTTVPYPIEVVEAVEFTDFEITGGYLNPASVSDLDKSFELMEVSLIKYRYEIPIEISDLDKTFELMEVDLIQLRYEIFADTSDLDKSFELMEVDLINKLVQALHPDEAVEFTFEITGGLLEAT